MIVLMGIKHCGKSTVGKLLAEKIDVTFFDSDDEIEKMVGTSVRSYYKRDGQEAFKKAEANVCEVIQSSFGATNAILATGGGVCDNEDALNALSDCSKVFLDVPEKIAFERIMLDTKKTGTLPAFIAKENPVNEKEVKEIFHQFYIRRTEMYKKLCPVHIIVGNETPEENCTTIISALGL